MSECNRSELLSMVKDSRVLAVPGDIINLENGEEVEIEIVVMSKASVVYYLADGVRFINNEHIRKGRGE